MAGKLAKGLLTVPLCSVNGACLDDLLAVGKDVAGSVGAIKSLATDCHGDDRTACQADVDKFLQTLSTAITHIKTCTTSCESKGPDCVAEITKLSDKIAAIDEPAKNMADECAGKDKSDLKCFEDGLRVSSDVLSVGSEVASVIKVCKAGENNRMAFEAAAPPPNGSSPDDLKCDLCEKIVQAAFGKGIDECNALCAKAGPIATVCESLCTVLQQDVPADKVCGLVKLCPKDIVVSVASGSHCPAPGFKKGTCCTNKGQPPPSDNPCPAWEGIADSTCCDGGDGFYWCYPTRGSQDVGTNSSVVV